MTTDDDPLDRGALLGAALGLDQSAKTLRAEADRLSRLSRRMFTLWQRAERKASDEQDVAVEGLATQEALASARLDGDTHCVDDADIIEHAARTDEPPSLPPAA